MRECRMKWTTTIHSATTMYQQILAWKLLFLNDEDTSHKCPLDSQALFFNNGTIFLPLVQKERREYSTLCKSEKFCSVSQSIFLDANTYFYYQMSGSILANSISI